MKTSVEFLGHIVSITGQSKSPSYIRKIDEFSLSETVGQLQEFFGIVNFQRMFGEEPYRSACRLLLVISETQRLNGR